MAKNGIPPRYNDSQEANYKAEANKKDNLLAVARLIPPGKSQELRPADITVHAALHQRDSKQLKCFQNKGFVLRSISNTIQLIQIIHFINETEIYVKLKQDWETLPPNWSVRDQTLSTRATHFTFFIPLCEEATADEEGDGIHLFDFDPTDGQSEARIGSPRRVTVACLHLPSSTRSSYSLCPFPSILCAEWKLSSCSTSLSMTKVPYPVFSSTGWRNISTLAFASMVKRTRNCIWFRYQSLLIRDQNYGRYCQCIPSTN